MTPRVSILNLLLVTTIVALAIVVIRLYRELDHESSLRLQLLQKGGILQVKDLDMVHVVKADSNSIDGSFSWRVYVPQKRSVSLNSRHDTMSVYKEIVQRFPPNAIVVGDRSRSNPVYLGPGEHVVTLWFDRDKPVFMLDVVGNGSRHTRGFGLPDRSLEWDLTYQNDITDMEHTRKTASALRSGQTLTVENGKAFVLDRHRYMRAARYTDELAKRRESMPADEAGELLVWLQPGD